MSKIIWVKSPTFQLNLDDPSRVYYNGECSGNCKSFIVQTYRDGVPNPNSDQIVYKYHHNRGIVLDVNNIKKNNYTDRALEDIFVLLVLSAIIGIFVIITLLSI
jgi:hypothetical protein